MTMPMNYLYTYSEAAHAEEMIPSMTYATLLENLVRLTKLGVIAPENPVTMLVVARIVDRSRILRSGVTTLELQRALDAYREARPVLAVEKALEKALETLHAAHPGRSLGSAV
jgi:hypothetical protein